MKQNIGGLDKLIRILAAVLVAVLYFMHQISGTTAIVLGIIAIIFTLTSLVGFCPLYSIFGVNTCKRK